MNLETEETQKIPSFISFDYQTTTFLRKKIY